MICIKSVLKKWSPYHMFIPFRSGSSKIILPSFRTLPFCFYIAEGSLDLRNLTSTYLDPRSFLRFWQASLVSCMLVTSYPLIQGWCSSKYFHCLGKHSDDRSLSRRQFSVAWMDNLLGPWFICRIDDACKLNFRERLAWP